jgi:hypothetical protein
VAPGGEQALALVNALPELVDAGVVVHWHQDSARLKSLDEAALSLRIERRQDWFQVEGCSRWMSTRSSTCASSCAS